MTTPFSKLQAAGNGYIAIDGRGIERDWPCLARAISDPHFGVGSDGLVVAFDSQHAPIRMRVFNSDGSEAEISGNGLRLFAKFVLDAGLARADEDGLRVETGAGLRTVAPTMRDGRMISGRVGMGVPCFDPARIPIRADAGIASTAGARLRLDVVGRSLDLTCLSIGNPHAVAILEEDIDDFPLAEVGPLVQNHGRFPERINFEIVNVLDRGHIRVRIFERGEGETLSSGTGSTAAVIAARVRGHTGDAVRVELRGGVLEVHWAGEGEALLEGPVEEVFRGFWPD